MKLFETVQYKELKIRIYDFALAYIPARQCRYRLWETSLCETCLISFALARGEIICRMGNGDVHLCPSLSVVKCSLRHAPSKKLPTELVIKWVDMSRKSISMCFWKPSCVIIELCTLYCNHCAHV